IGVLYGFVLPLWPSLSCGASRVIHCSHVIMAMLISPFRHLYRRMPLFSVSAPLISSLYALLYFTSKLARNPSTSLSATNTLFPLPDPPLYSATPTKCCCYLVI